MNYTFTYTDRKLRKFQKKIQETERKNPRLCRNFQRRLYRSSSIQLLIINEILQLQLKRSRKKKEILYYLRYPVGYQCGFTNQYPIIFSKLIAKEYRYFLTRQIFNILWVFALSPILDNKKKDQIILTGLKDSQIYPTIYTFFKKPFIQYIAISQFSNFFNQKNKYWILSNLLIEKKFFLNWLKLNQRTRSYAPLLLSLKDRNISDEFTLQKKNDHQLKADQIFLTPKKKPDPLSLKITLENFVNLSFSDFLEGIAKRCSLSQYNRFAQSSYYFPKYQNRQTLFHSTISDPISPLKNGLDGRFSDTNWSVGFPVCPLIGIQPRPAPLVKAGSGSRSEGQRSESICRAVNYLKLFVQKLCQRIVFIDVILLLTEGGRSLRREEASRRSRVRVDPIYKRLQIDSQKLKIKLLLPSPGTTKPFAMLDPFNNIDLQNGSRKTVNGITSSFQQFSKDILPSRISKFLYDAKVRLAPLSSPTGYFASSQGDEPVNKDDSIRLGWPVHLTLASSHQLHKKLQPPIHFFYKHLMEYNGLILLALKKKRDFRLSHNSLIYYAQIHGLKINFIKFYSLDQGLYFLGWFFHKKNHSFEGFISHKNISNHQKELNHCLKTSENKPIDKIIYELNQKILRWQKFYNCSIQFSKACSQFDRKFKLNDDLFWLIWRWIKKRHRNRSSKWLYTRYWKKSTSRRWIFSANQHTLIFYIR